jgi:hypothetical protein
VFSPNRSERLDPPRLRLNPPRRATLVRAALVAALLCLAAGALVTGQPPDHSVPGSVPVAVPSGFASEPPAPPGLVGLPLRLHDAGVVAVVRAGQRVDVLASDGVRPANLLASDVLVLRATAHGQAPEDGALLYLAVTREQAVRLAGITTDAQITVTVRAP